MIFALNFFNLPVDLHGIISTRGEIYFVALDVAKLTEDPSTTTTTADKLAENRARLWSSKQVKDIILGQEPKSLFPDSVLNTWIISKWEAFQHLQTGAFYYGKTIGDALESPSDYLMKCEKLQLYNTFNVSITCKLWDYDPYWKFETLYLSEYFQRIVDAALKAYDESHQYYRLLSPPPPPLPATTAAEYSTTRDSFSSTDTDDDDDQYEYYSRPVNHSTTRDNNNSSSSSNSRTTTTTADTDSVIIDDDNVIADPQNMTMDCHFDTLSEYQFSKAPETLKVFFGGEKTVVYKLITV